MFEYYFYKKGYYYVVNDKLEVFRVTLANNIDYILNEENKLKLLKNLREIFLNVEPKMLSIDEFDSTRLFHFFNASSLFFINQMALFKENALCLSVLETLGFTIYQKGLKYRNKSLENSKNNELIYLDMYIDKLEKQLEQIKSVSHYNIEQVDLSFLEPNMVKKPLNNWNSWVEEILNETISLVGVNASMAMYAESDECTMSSIDIKNFNQLMGEFPNESLQKIAYQNKEEEVNENFWETVIPLFMMYSYDFVNKNLHLYNNKTIQNVVYLLTLSLSIYFGRKFLKSRKELKEMEEPNLILKK